ncbi:MAG: urea ABC transporter permease subunit UrtB, partial [Alphaproteobacteria bacterium]|nr:urea ABC transporter permease subunit UrtB [Alphaproteobacteria bacterium]
MIRTVLAILFMAAAILSAPGGAAAQAPASVDEIFETHADIIIKGSRRTIEPAIAAFRDSGLPDAQTVLEKWREKEIWVRKADQRFFTVTTDDRRTYRLFDIVTGEPRGEAAKRELKQIKPNSGVRGLISSALVEFQLNDPDPAVRLESLTAIQRDADASQLAPLRASIERDLDPEIRAQKERLATLLTIQFATDPDERIAAIRAVSSDLGIDVRAALNPILDTKVDAYTEPPDANIARELEVGTDLTRAEAYALLVAQGAPAPISDDMQKAALAEHADGARVGGVPVASLVDPEARDRAYSALAAAGLVPPAPTAAERRDAVAAHRFFAVYDEPNAAVTDAARDALDSIGGTVTVFEMLDLSLDALSLASIYFLAAIGLAITFGVMRVINMAHGEFIMMGAYTGFVVQQVIPNFTVSILVALPLAFVITFMAGVALERLVIRYLYDRP